MILRGERSITAQMRASWAAISDCRRELLSSRAAARPTCPLRTSFELPVAVEVFALPGQFLIRENLDLFFLRVALARVAFPLPVR